MFSYKNKTVVVTGGGSGIGRAVSLGFAKQGAHVHIIEINTDNANETISEIEKNGGTVTAHSCDVSNQQQEVKKFNHIEKIDVLVNNAGVSHVGTVETTPEADFTRLFNINVKGIYNCLYAVVPLMKKHGGGAILNMSSIAAQIGLPDRFAYSMTKGAVHAM